jgi:hypothetical protein
MRIPPSSFAVLSANRGQSHQLPKPEKALAQSEQKIAPPGLERALARLQPERNAGQAMAFGRITSHLDRYAQTQALGAPPLPSFTPTPETSTLVASEDSGVESTA